MSVLFTQDKYRFTTKKTLFEVNPVVRNVTGQGFPPNGTQLLMYLNFNVIDIGGTKYFQDKSLLGLNALALTTTTPYDSIQLNTDIRLQNSCNSAGCFSQFYNGTSPDISNTAKTVLLTDLSQLYLDNYIFSYVTNNIFLIYSAEQVGNNLTIILDRIGARIEKMTEWGISQIEGAVAFDSALKVSDDIICCSPYDVILNPDIINFNIKTKTTDSFPSYFVNNASNSHNPYQVFIKTPNGHIIGFPYNDTRICDIDPIAKAVSFFGDFSTGAQGRFNVNRVLLLGDNGIIALPRTLNYVVKYNYVTHLIENFGTLTAGTVRFNDMCYINDNLIVVIPWDYNKIINIDGINKTIDEYGSIGTSTLKVGSYEKINDDLICCISRNMAYIFNIIPSSKTVETYGTFTGTNNYMSSVKLTKGEKTGHVLAIPATNSQILDIDPIAKTYRQWGNLGGTTFKFWTQAKNEQNISLIELDNGHVLAFPDSYNYIIDIDPINEVITNISDLGNAIGKFRYSSVNLSYINDIINQILCYPVTNSTFLDYNPETNRVFKIGNLGINAGLNNTISINNNMIFDGLKRILLAKTHAQGIIDITLR